ncbi:hypothetical protein BASA83_004451 [Batrachochytrium salamandrivorans]|nr:hypothetical protein BASA83_004451 [Batrachochytrium salamandrivorans]
MDSFQFPPRDEQHRPLRSLDTTNSSTNVSRAATSSTAHPNSGGSLDPQTGNTALYSTSSANPGFNSNSNHNIHYNTNINPNGSSNSTSGIVPLHHHHNIAAPLIHTASADSAPLTTLALRSSSVTSNAHSRNVSDASQSGHSVSSVPYVSGFVSSIPSRPHTVPDPDAPRTLGVIRSNAVPIVLQTVFARFVHAAESKVQSLLYIKLDRDEDISRPLNAGADPAFDRLLVSIGSISKHCPKLIIDSIMVWRKSKGDHTMNTVPDKIRVQYPNLKSKDLLTILKERKSLLANFVLCRVLTAIISQLGKNTLPNDLGEKLEDMVFGQLKNADPDLVVKSVNRQANVDMFAELIGALSNIRFSTVSDRFISEIGCGAAVTKEIKLELKLELIIRSMRFLKLKIYPMDCLEETAEFLQTSADLFQNAHDIHVKHAYANLFVELLDPIASVATAEVNLPAWQKTVNTIYPKAARMAHKSRHLPAALPLISTLLCVSKKDFFHKNWFDFVQLLLKRFKEKGDSERELKQIAFASLTRLIWVYLFRCFESPASTVQRRMDEIFRILFSPNKRGVVPTECDPNSFVRIVYFVLVKYPEYGNDIVGNLLGNSSLNLLPTVTSLLAFFSTSQISSGYSEADLSHNYTRNIEVIPNPERLLVALRSFLLFLSDVEYSLGDSQGSSSTTADHHANNSRTIGSLESLVDLAQHNASSRSACGISQIDGSSANRLPVNECLEDEVLHRMGGSIRDTLDTINSLVGRILLFLDQTLGGILIMDAMSLSMAVPAGSTSGGTIGSAANIILQRPAISLAEAFPGSIYTPIVGASVITAMDKERTANGDVFGKDRAHLDLLRVVLESIPRYSPHGIPPLKVIEVVSRLLLHLDKDIRAVAAAALGRIARIKTSSIRNKFWVITDTGESISAAVLRISASVCMSIIGYRLADLCLCKGGMKQAMQGFLTIYLDLVEIWYERFIEKMDDPHQSFDEYESSWMIDEIESRGLIFLATGRPSFRDAAIKAFHFANSIDSKLEQARKARAAVLSASNEIGLDYPVTLDRNRPLLAEENSTLVRLSALRGSTRNTLQRKKTIQLPKPISEEPESSGTQSTYQSSKTPPTLRENSLSTDFKSPTSQSDAQHQIVRIINIMTNCGQDLIKKHYFDNFLPTFIRHDHQKVHQQHRRHLASLLSKPDCLAFLAASEDIQDQIIWKRCFPDLLKWIMDYASPIAVKRSINDMFLRVQASHAAITMLADPAQAAGMSKGASAAVNKWVMDRVATEKRNVGSNVGSGIASSSTSSSGSVNSSGGHPGSSGNNIHFINHSSASGFGDQPSNADTFLIDGFIEEWKTSLIFVAMCYSPPESISVRKGSTFTGSVRGGVNTNASSDYGASHANTPFHGTKNVTFGDRDARTRHHIYSSAAPFNIDGLIKLVLPLLWCETVSIRQAASLSLGSIHPNCYGSLLFAIQPTIHAVIEDMRSRSTSGRFEPSRRANMPQPSTSAQGKRFERVRMEITHIFSLIAEFVEYEFYRSDPTIMRPVLELIRSLAQFLSDPEAQLEWDHQMLRYYFCCFIDKFHRSLASVVGKTASGLSNPHNPVARSETVETYIPFALRLEIFFLFDSWCGFGLSSDMTRDREARMMKVVLEQVKDITLRATVTSTLEEQRKALEVASLKAISSLCNGTISSRDNAYLQLDLTRLIAWINAILESAHTEYHPIARKAIENLLSNNVGNERLTEELLQQCYHHQTQTSTGMIGAQEESKITLCYFMAFVDLVGRRGPAVPISTAKIICLALYHITSDSAQRRKGAARLLLSIDRHIFGSDGDNSTLAANVRQMFDCEPLSGDYLISRMNTYDSENGTLDIGNDMALGGHDHEDDMAEELLVSEDDLLREVQATYETAAITSSLPLVFKYAQGMVSQRLATERPELTYEMFSELVYRIHLLAERSVRQTVIRDLLVTLTPWLSNLELDGCFSYDPSILDGSYLHRSESQVVAQATTTMVLSNLFYLTSKFSDIFVVEIESLWVHLVDAETSFQDNHELSRSEWVEKRISTIVDYLLLVGLERRNPRIVATVKRISVCICRTPACSALIGEVMAKLSPKDMVPSSNQLTEMVFLQCPNLPGHFTANMDDSLWAMPDRPAFSPGQLAFTLLVEVAIEIGNFALRPHLPLLLNTIFVQLDHFIFLICEQARSLLVNMMQAMLPRDTHRESIDATLTALNLKEGKRLWNYEDISPLKPQIDSFHQLSALALEILDLFHTVHPMLRQTWGRIALDWGTGCPVRHIACRSLQIFRTLQPIFTQHMVGDLLVRLSATLGDLTEDVQGYTLELIETLQWMVLSLSDERLIYFPQLFWASVAILHSPHEGEFEKGARLLDSILARLDLYDSRVMSLIQTSLPTRWKGDFFGLQPLILKGLCSSRTEKLSLDIINRMILLPPSLLIETSQSSRVIFSVLANLPRLLQVFNEDDFSTHVSTHGDDEEHPKPILFAQAGSNTGVGETTSALYPNPIEVCRDIAHRLSQACKANGHTGLSRLLDAYGKKRFRSTHDFLLQLASVIRESFFPKWEPKVMHFLVSLLGNTMVMYREHVLLCLRMLFPDGQPEGVFRLGSGAAESASGATSHTTGDPGSIMGEEEWIQPLLDLLETDLAPVATKVLDEVLAGRVALNETDLALVFGSKTIYNIANDTTSGPPAVSSLPSSYAGGRAASANATPHSQEWRVKEPAKAAATAKYNMSGVAMTCAGSFVIFSHDETCNDPNSAQHSTFNPELPISSEPSSKNTDNSTSFKPLPTVPSSPFDPILSDLADDDALLEWVNDLEGYFGEASRVYLESVDSSKELVEGIDCGIEDMAYSTPHSGESRDMNYASSQNYHTNDVPSDGRLPDLQSSSVSESMHTSHSTSYTSKMAPHHLNNVTIPITSPILIQETQVPRGKLDTITPAQRLLARPKSKVVISFRLFHSFHDTMKDPEFAYWVRTDIMTSLRLPRIECVELIKLEPIVTPNVNLPAREVDRAMDYAPVTAAVPATLVTVAILGPKEGSGFESAAYAEELWSLITQDLPGAAEERRLLLSGVVTHNLNTTWMPELYIEFSGLSVPYAPEGLKFMVPHRSQDMFTPPLHRSDITSQTVAGAALSLGSHSQPTNTRQAIPNSTLLNAGGAHLGHASLSDELVVFCDAFELSQQFHMDFLDLVGNTAIQANAVGENGARLNSISALVRKSLYDCNSCAPAWVGPNAAGILKAAVDELEYLERTTPGSLASFLDLRHARMLEFNLGVTTCISARQEIDGLLSGRFEPMEHRASVASQVEHLGRSILDLQQRVVNLETVFESALGRSGRWISQ